ncbi:hypothetical protein D6C76_04410 [Aureobasidium pullulans]|nr:hypothetical protein D6C76_04410 [Aureobasidium pullulans]
MPPYSVTQPHNQALHRSYLTPQQGIRFQILLHAQQPDAMVAPVDVSAREWESCVTNHLPRYPNYDILGRIRNLDVELFGNFTALQTELEGLDYTVRPYDRSKCMSIYPDTEVKNRNLVQKLQDQLYEALQADGEEIGYALIAATQSEWVLICKLDRGRFSPENPCPPELTALDAVYNTIGYMLDNDVFILAPERDVKKYYLNKPPWVIYKLLDKTINTEYERHQQEEKEEKSRQHKREKRKAKKLAAKLEVVGTEQERLGALLAGKDDRSGGKAYKKDKVIEEVKAPAAVIVAVTPEKKPEVKKVEVVKEKPWAKEVKKQGWFFSGEDVLKDA